MEITNLFHVFYGFRNCEFLQRVDVKKAHWKRMLFIAVFT